MLGCKGWRPPCGWADESEKSLTLEISEGKGFQEREGEWSHTYAGDLGMHSWNVEAGGLTEVRKPHTESPLGLH